ncbi:MAG: argininosuccinate synthase [Candidatus Dormibacteraeota bacterium]|nr:argininosuccinate synthase [Candidatus Dormibacteraeota bacterium]MBV9524846.1 argininosuccinate synthase [Candidatus Dormibacteraeota bacterium]
MSERCVLAYSGGLDTSVAIRWLQEQLGYEVVTLTADLGEAKDVDAVAARALRTGAVSAHVVDAKRIFIEHFCFPTLAAGALYEGVYPLATALARPLIAKLLVDVAREEGAVAVAHGCTGKGNDQVRFDVAVGALAPELRVVAPVRDWDMGRPQEIEYAARHGIDVPVTTDSPYSVDANLWGRSVECGVLEDPWAEPPADVFEWTQTDGASSDGVIEVGFESGTPTSLDGETLAPEELVARLNAVAGAHGVGRIDHVEDRLVGIKSREVYEAPAAVVLHMAHGALESLTLTRDLQLFKRHVADEWGRLVYDGLWFGALRAALEGFVRATQEHVSGSVRLRLGHGEARVTGRRAQRSLYQSDLATYDRTQDRFDHGAARGFIELFGLPLRTQTRVQGALDDAAPLPVQRRTRRRGDG